MGLTFKDEDPFIPEKNFFFTVECSYFPLYIFPFVETPTIFFKFS